MVKEKTYIDKGNINRYVSGIGFAANLGIDYERLMEIVREKNIDYRWQLEGTARIMWIPANTLEELERIVDRASYTTSQNQKV